MSRAPRRERDEESKLRDLAETLGRTAWAVELFDARWQLVWVSDETKVLLGETDERRLGYGCHLVEAWLAPVRRAVLTPGSSDRSLAEVAAMTFEGTPGGREGLRRRLGDRWPPELDAVLPVTAPEIWAWSVDYSPLDATTVNSLQALMVRVRDEDGRLVGTFFLYGSGLPASVFALLVRGDEELFKRTAQLVEPQLHPTAILFADLEGSGALAERLPAHTYFELLRALLTGIDELVAARGGIVGKHGGDGATAFFLADQLGSAAAAAGAALDVARAVPGLAASAAARSGAAGDLRVNVGAHWAEQLYLGQVITGGRLEVTALGDEVNECARLQQSARHGELIASKAVLDQLRAEDRASLDLAGPLRFGPLGELPGATEKAIRDAGDLPVARL